MVTNTETIRPREMKRSAERGHFASETDPFIAPEQRSRGIDRTSRESASCSTHDSADSEVPDWVYCRISDSMNIDSVNPPARVAPSVSSLLRETATKPSGETLRNVRCRCDEEKITLSGTVSHFADLQTAVDAAMELAEGRRIELRIEVQSEASTCT